MRCRSGKARWKTKTESATSASRRPGGASGSVIARVGLLTELGVSARASRTRGKCAQLRVTRPLNC
jgi:hypothetical protein